MVVSKKTEPTVNDCLLGIVFRLFLQEATKMFIGSHNFASFRSAKCQVGIYVLWLTQKAVSPVRDINEFQIVQPDLPFELTSMPNLKLIHFVIKARAFLHSQVKKLPL